MTKQAPAGTTHLWQLRDRTEFWRETGEFTKEGHPKFVRFIHSRNDWAKTPVAIDASQLVEVAS